MSHQRAFEAYGARLAETRQHGADAIGIEPMNLTRIAEFARQRGGDITDPTSPWGETYAACHAMNQAILVASFQLGKLIDPKGPPPEVGPTFFLT